MENMGHGGKPIIERVMPKDVAVKRLKELREAKAKEYDVRLQIATEIIDIAYGFFTPLEGFMTKADVDSVCDKMTLSDGSIWSIPIVFDISEEKLKSTGIKKDDTVILTYTGNPLAIFDVTDVFELDKKDVAMKVYGTTEEKHPGVKRTYNYRDKFLGGKITLLNPPRVNPPYDKFWFTPLQLREKFKEKGWVRIVNHQTRNVPHTGHEWLCKGAWLQTYGELPIEKPIVGVLINAIMGEKRVGDYIDEAIILTHDRLRTAGYFGEHNHMTSCTFWDMRYAGPREAIFHACLRTNLGLTHHMFGRDHAGVGSYYGPYDAHRLLASVQDKINITPTYSMNWLYCPHCGEITSEGICDHKKEWQKFSGTVVRSIIIDGVKPPRLI
jgi:sulfate adenylyltransferase